MFIINITKKSLKKLREKIRDLAIRIGFLEKSLEYMMLGVSVVRSDPDSEGIYRKVDFRRKDGTLIQTTLLVHDKDLEINGGIYNKRSTLIYDETGTSVTDTSSCLLKYDERGFIISETLIF